MPKRSFVRTPIVDDADVERTAQLFYRGPEMGLAVSESEFLRRVYIAVLALEFERSPEWKSLFAKRVVRRIEWRMRDRQPKTSNQG
jgi:hypothetical protein